MTLYFFSGLITDDDCWAVGRAFCLENTVAAIPKGFALVPSLIWINSSKRGLLNKH